MRDRGARVIGHPLNIEPQGATSLALFHLGFYKSSGRIRAPFLEMESMMPTCRQNHTQAQNNYDSAENCLKKGVLRPIFPAGLEIRPHPPKGGPPSQILSRARGRRFMRHPSGAPNIICLTQGCTSPGGDAYPGLLCCLPSGPPVRHASTGFCTTSAYHKISHNNKNFRVFIVFCG